jgi:hypothetical protein
MSATSKGKALAIVRTFFQDAGTIFPLAMNVKIAFQYNAPEYLAIIAPLV